MSRATLTCTVAACALLVGCSSSPGPRYFDYSGADGCSPPNIGHRLGGDLDQYSDNSLEGLLGIAHMQRSPCFKNWEFDLTESADGLVLRHDSQYNGLSVSALSLEDLPKATVSASQLLKAFSLRVATKPIIIDLKTLKTLPGLRQAKNIAEQLSATQTVDVWFIASKENTERGPDLCSVLGADFEVLLYSQGGPYCSTP
ncbi:MAG: hypothetical protein ACI9NT_000160 [Bacteroidia bacterium]